MKWSKETGLPDDLSELTAVIPVELLLAQVRSERHRQDEMWGTSFVGRDPNEWLAILMEEVGEVAEAIKPSEIAGELVQVAAVALSWAEHMHTQGRVDQFSGGDVFRRRIMELGEEARAILEVRGVDDPTGQEATT